PVFVPDGLLSNFDIIKRDEFRINVPFTREGWHGRMRACRGVGAAMNETQLAAWDEDHKKMLADEADEEFNVKHYISYAELVVKK
ncbi:MAG: class I SAM-dependent methyltransferase, partial [Lachnospiraceae bacterium]|nr:class I SAM-dependent methyltransferase [Lachnospiraceae bacterium]